MSAKSQKGLTSTHLLFILVFLLLGIGAGATLWGVSWSKANNQTAKNDEASKLRDPLPGELVMETLLQQEDSIQDYTKDRIKKEMMSVITEYRKRFRHEHFTGYFLTDLNKDGVPELWVKVGTYRDNAQLELYYPMPDGSLRKSHTFAEPGQYYVGDDYLIQVVGSGPGYVNVNRITIKNGEMQVDNEHGIDLYSDPDASIPTFAEREIRDTSFKNLSPLDKALSL